MIFSIRNAIKLSNLNEYRNYLYKLNNFSKPEIEKSPKLKVINNEHFIEVKDAE